MAGPSSRMLALLSLLQVHRDWPGDELAGRLEVSPRTVRRDVDRLRELGYRVEALRGPAGGYRLAAGSDLPPLLFDEDHAVALAYGAWGEKLVNGEVTEGIVRSTVVLDPEGKVRLTQYQVKAQGHVAALREELGV